MNETIKDAEKSKVEQSKADVTASADASTVDQCGTC